MTGATLARKVVGTYLALAGTVACLTVLFLSMRAIMEVGGTCGSGGPYEIAVPCPKGVGWMMFLSVLGGLAFLAVYAASTMGLPGPHLWPLAWSALFLSLGWNFWAFGLNPPAGSGDDASVGWIICGVLFVLMGGLPLLALLNRRLARSVLWGDVDATPPTGPLLAMNLNGTGMKVYMLVMHACGIVSGVAGGIWFFYHFSR